MQRIDAADLGRQSDKALQAARRGEIVTIEREGQEEAVLLDTMNYRLLRAAARFCFHPHPEDPEARRLEELLAQAPDDQARYDLVIGYFLDQRPSLSRAAQLLGTVYIDLRIRPHQVGLPTYQGPATVEEARAEVEAARLSVEATHREEWMASHA